MVVSGTFTTNKRGKRTLHLTTATAARTALREVRALKREVEVKHLDNVSNDPTLAQTGTVTDIFSPSTGTGDNGRIGDKVTLNRVSMRMKIEALTTVATKPFGYVRVILVWVKTITAATPAVTDILRSGLVYSLYNINTPVNYKILHDQTYYMIDGTPANVFATGGGKAEHIVKKDFTLNEVHDNDGTQVKGRLCQILVHDYEDEDISVNWQYRCRYTDL